MPKKISKNIEIIPATRKFTDREKPRKVFWDKYNLMKENINSLDDIYIINYYGVGGIGKSTLLKKIISELKEQEKKPYYVYFDFESSTDIKTILSMIKTKLENDYNYSFPLFDTAIYTYAKKIGESVDKPEVKSFIEQSKVLSLIMDGATEIPIVGIGAKIIKYADTTASIIRSNSGKYKKAFQKLEIETAEETYKNLPYYFSCDLMDNIEKLKQPLVILLDTYEKLVNEVSNDGYSFMKDLWLRGDNGLVVQIPGILWVIAGREKIRWERYDKDWEGTLDQHILGDLSINDTIDYLTEAGIASEKLRKEIYKLTNGTPVYLDICVSTYEILSSNGEEITIDKFGKNIEVLVERYIKYMDIPSREMVYMLSEVGNFNDEMIMEIGPKILPGFSYTLYEAIKKLSFIFDSNDVYYIHKTVNKIFQSECPKTIKNKTNEVLRKYYENYLNDVSNLNANWSNYVEQLAKVYINLFNETESDEIVYEGIYKLSVFLYNNDEFDNLKKYYTIFNNSIGEKIKDKDCYIVMEMIKALLMKEERNIIKARNIIEKVLNKAIEINNTKLINNSISQLTEIYETFPNYKYINKIVEYLESIFDEKNFEDTTIYSLFYFYKLTKERIKTERILEILLNTEGNEEIKPIVINEYLKDFEFNNSALGYEKLKLYLDKLIELLKNPEISDGNKCTINVSIASYLYKDLNEYEETLKFLNTAEKIILETNNLDNYSTLIYYKYKALLKIDKEKAQEYILEEKEKIDNNLDKSNIHIQKAYLTIYNYLNIDKDDLYNKWLTEYYNNKDYDKLYELLRATAYLFDDIIILEKYSKMTLNKIFEIGLDDDNIDIAFKICYQLLKLNEDIQEQKQACYNYYYDKYGNTTLFVPILYETSDNTEEKKYEILKQVENIYKKEVGEDSLITAHFTEAVYYRAFKLGKAEAKDYIEKAYNIYKDKLGENDITTINALCLSYQIDINNGNKDLLDELLNLYETTTNDNIKCTIAEHLIKKCNKYLTAEQENKLYLFIHNILKKSTYLNTEYYINITYNLALSYYDLDDLETSYKLFKECYEKYRKIDNEDNMLTTSSRLINIYYAQKNIDEAYKLAKERYEIKNNNDKYTLEEQLDAQEDYGYALYRKKEYHSALTILNDGFEKSQKELKNKFKRIIAFTYDSLKEYEKSNELYKELLNNAKENNDKEKIIDYTSYLSDNYYSQEKYEDSLKYSFELIKLSNLNKYQIDHIFTLIKAKHYEEALPIINNIIDELEEKDLYRVYNAQLLLYIETNDKENGMNLVNKITPLLEKIKKYPSYNKIIERIETIKKM